tara:strand:+ start:261 stop:917 length:657 start_codon:yes stop_codon:yes gene_type:complete
MVNSLFMNNSTSAGLSFLQSRYNYVSKTIDNDEEFELKIELLKFEKLKDDALNNLLTYLDNIFIGNYSVLETDKTSEVFDTIGKLLVNDNHFSFSKSEIIEYQISPTTFYQYKSFIHKIINSLNATTLLYLSNENLQDRIDLLNEYKNILTNKELLKDYIDRNYTNFQTNFVTIDYQVNQSLKLPREYIVYLELYGIPQNGYFDSERLNNIKESLGLN